MVAWQRWQAMARQLRIEYAGAVHHVMARGNQEQPIFADDLDRQACLNTLGQACEKTGWRFMPAGRIVKHFLQPGNQDTKAVVPGRFR
jgi:hypothetical protein